MANRQGSAEKMQDTLHRASGSLQALMDWVKYLRVVQDLRDLTVYESNSGDQRRDDRFCLHDVYQKHVFMNVSYNTGKEVVSVLDFSQHGIRFLGFSTVSPGTIVDCRLSTSSGLAEEIGFQVRVAHCQPSGKKFIVGAEITTVDDEDALQVYKKLYGFILKMAEKGGDDL
jgi:hypothetical protein